MLIEDYSFNEFLGKKVTVDLEKMSSEDPELYWDADYLDDETMAISGTGHINLDYRHYNDDTEENSVSNVEADECDADENTYDETVNWRLQTGLDFEVNELGCISSVEITAEVSCFGDSGLGDCSPEDEWTPKDYRLARAFLSMITAQAT